MSTVDLTISTKYIPDWGVYDGVREIVQNAVDEKNWDYSYSDGVLTFSNESEIPLDVKSLLLGHTTKEGKNKIGKWGEGYKMAFLCLLRNKKQITIYNGTKEIWKPYLKKSKIFKEEIVSVKIDRKLFGKKGLIEVKIEGISEIEMVELRKKILWLQDKTFINENRILHRIEKGTVFVKGMWICDNSDLNFTYNFDTLNIDRDRKVVDWSKVYFETSKILSESLTTEELHEGLKKDWKELSYIYHFVPKGLKEILQKEVTEEITPYVESGKRTVSSAYYYACVGSGISTTQKKPLKERMIEWYENNENAESIDWQELKLLIEEM